MKTRPVKILPGGIVSVPLGRSGKHEAKIGLDDYQELLSLRIYPNWQMRGGSVGARGPNGVRVSIPRVLMDARPGEGVVYKDGDPTNLTRPNLKVVEKFSVQYDRGLLTLPHSSTSEKDAAGLIETGTSAGVETQAA